MTQTKRSRRDFMSLSGVGMAGLMGAPLMSGKARAQSRQSVLAGSLNPDRIVLNAKVYTVDAAAPRAEAFAVIANKLSAEGSSADIRALAGLNTAEKRGLSPIGPYWSRSCTLAPLNRLSIA